MRYIQDFQTDKRWQSKPQEFSWANKAAAEAARNFMATQTAVDRVRLAQALLERELEAGWDAELEEESNG